MTANLVTATERKGNAITTSAFVWWLVDEVYVEGP